jgi:hypothetical protein
MNDQRDAGLMLARITAGAVAAIVFAVAGRKMNVAGSDALDGGFLQAMAWFCYGMAVLSLLLALPTRLRATTAAATEAPAAPATCPRCPEDVVPGRLAEHLVAAHGVTREAARVEAAARR